MNDPYNTTRRIFAPSLRYDRMLEHLTREDVPGVVLIIYVTKQDDAMPYHIRKW